MESKLRKIAVDLSCYDYRLNSIEGMDRTVRKKLPSLPGPVLHIHDERLFRLERIIATLDLHNRIEEWRKLLQIVRGERNLDTIPLGRLLSSITVFYGRMAQIEWILPLDLEKKVRDIIVEWAEQHNAVYIVEGKAFPIMNCTGSLDLGGEVLEESIRLFSELQKRRIQRKPNGLDVVVYTVLYYDPLASLHRLRRMLYLLTKELLLGGEASKELRSSYVAARYKRLSKRGFIGRVWLPSIIWDTGFQVFHIAVDSRCSEEAYGVFASTLGSHRIIIGPDLVLARVLLPTRIRDRALRVLSDCVEVVHVEYQRSEYPPPYHYYDFTEKKWKITPHMGSGSSYWEMVKKIALRVFEEKRKARSKGKS